MNLDVSYGGRAKEIHVAASSFGCPEPRVGMVHRALKNFVIGKNIICKGDKFTPHVVSQTELFLRKFSEPEG